jgi:hypothetical protein
MQHSTTVFLFTDKATPYLTAHILLVGTGLLVGAVIIWIVRNTMRRKETVDPRLLALILIGFMFAFIQGVSLFFFLQEYLPLRQAYSDGNYPITEGSVHVLSTQPAGGHAPGDSIMIGQRLFTIDYFRLSPGYTQTIAYQGVLTEGVTTRITSSGDTILRIDLK